MRDVRFRRALSLAIDRSELNEVVYIGLATPSNNTIMKRSELFKADYANKWAQYDPSSPTSFWTRSASTRRRPGHSPAADGSRRPSWSSMPARKPKTPMRCI